MPAAEHDIPTKIFLGSLSFDTDEKKLRDTFGKMGPINEILLMRDKESGLSRGFGFITYKNPSDAKDAVSRMNETELDGKFIKVDMALKGIKQQSIAARGSPSGRGMDRGRGGFRGRGGPLGSRGRGFDSFSVDRPLLSGPPGRGGPTGRGGPLGRGGPPSRGGPPGRGGPLGGPPSRGSLMSSSRGSPYSSRGGPLGGPPLDRDDYPRSASAVPRVGPPRSGKEPLLSAPPASAMGDFRPRGYDRAYERDPDPRRDHTPRSAYDAEQPIGDLLRRAYPEEYGAARETRREARDPYAPPARDSYSTAAASRPTYDYSLPTSRDPPTSQRDFPPATARTASRFDDERGAPATRAYERAPPREFSGERTEATYGRDFESYSLPASRDTPSSQRDFLPATARTASRFDDERGAPATRAYERAPPREFGGERAETAFGRDYEREAAPSRSSAYGEQYGRSQARAPEHEYAGSTSAAPRYDPYVSRDSYDDARSARPTEKSPFGVRDSYGSPSSAGGRGAYPTERVARPLDRNGGGPPPSARAPPPSRGYERY